MGDQGAKDVFSFQIPNAQLMMTLAAETPNPKKLPQRGCAPNVSFLWAITILDIPSFRCGFESWLQLTYKVYVV